MQFNLIVVNDQTFSLIPILMVTSLGAAVAIVHGDREGHPRGRSRRRRRRALSRLVRWLLRREIAPPIEPFTWSVARHPLRPFTHGDSKRIGRVPFPRKRKWPEVAVMVDVFLMALMALSKTIYVCRTYQKRTLATRALAKIRS